MELDMQLFGNLQASQSHQQDGKRDEVDDHPPAHLHDTLQYASTTALSPIQEEFDSSGAHSDVRISSHNADDLPGTTLPPTQPRQGEQVTSEQHVTAAEPSVSQLPPSHHVSHMSATGLIPVQPPQ